MREFEADNKKAISDKKDKIKEAATKESLLEQRKQTLASFNEANPDFQITDDIIANDLPPRMMKDLEEGNVTFEKFLENAKDYLDKGKVVAGAEETIKDDETPTQVNLSDQPGTNHPGS